MKKRKTPTLNFGPIRLGVLAEGFLQNVRVRRLDPLIIMLFGLHDFEAELLVEIDGALVIHLDVPKQTTSYS